MHRLVNGVALLGSRPCIGASVICTAVIGAQ